MPGWRTEAGERALDSSEQVGKLRPFLGLWGLSFPICQMKALDWTKSCDPVSQLRCPVRKRLCLPR